jgi:tetratricopeptide (TPR) repeat protein
MKTIVKYLIAFCLFHICFSCSKQPVDVEILLENAKSKMEQQPDSALQLLNTVLFPEDLSKSRFNKYNLLLIQAKDKSYKDITSDTLIFAVKDYYVQKKDYPNAALAAFYCGRVWHEQNKIEKAMDAYLEAEKYAEHIEDNNLKGLIQGNLGILYREHSSYEKAIELAKNAVVMYEKAKNYKNKISALVLTGNCFALSEKIDSAFYYYNDGLKLADSCHIPELQSNVRQSMGVIYRQIENYEQAKKLFNEALSFPNDSVEQARILLNIAQVYIIEDKIDSVNFYLDKASTLHISNPRLMRTSYFLKSKIAEKHNYYQEALNCYKEYYQSTMKVFDSERNNKLLEIQAKYDYEKLKNSQNQLIIKQQKAEITLSLILLAAVIIILVYYRKYAQNKQTLLEAEQKIISLQKIAQEPSEEKQSLRNTLFQHLNIMTKTALIESEITEEERKNGQKLLKKFNKIVYGQDTLNWDKLYQIMNNIQNGYYDEIKGKYPQWNEPEFRVFCLTHENQFSDTEIAIILNKTLHMIRKIRSKIRKDMGTPRYSHDFTGVF